MHFSLVWIASEFNDLILMICVTIRKLRAFSSDHITEREETRGSEETSNLKMHISLVFRAVLLIYLLALMSDGTALEKMSKRKPKSLGARSKSKMQKTKFWVTLDPTLNISMAASPSPERSVSPWTYKTSFDDSQTPSKISEAQCDKKGCFNEDGDEDWGLESRPIYYQINTLRRVKDRKSKHYALRLESKVVSLGCTCVLPVVVPQN